MVVNSLLVLPAAAARNIARNLREYHLFSILGALIAGVAGLITRETALNYAENPEQLRRRLDA